MPSYETIDAVADAYTPILFLGYLIYSVLYWRRGDRAATFKGLAGIAVAYAIMALDAGVNLWKSLGLDYSTHSAVALALVIFHLHKRPWRSAAALAIAMSLLVYYAVEVYQRYHTVLDIITTVVTVGPIVIAAYRLIERKAWKTPIDKSPG